MNIYGLIVGTGNVTSAGSCIMISFKAKSTIGVSSVHLYDAGVCDEKRYISLSVTDGAVTIAGTENPPPSGP